MGRASGPEADDPHVRPGWETTFFEPAEFAWVAEVESACAAIRAELDEVLQEREAVPNFQDISSDQRTSDDRWKTLVSYVYGQPVPENRAADRPGSSTPSPV